VFFGNDLKGWKWVLSGFAVPNWFALEILLKDVDPLIPFDSQSIYILSLINILLVFLFLGVLFFNFVSMNERFLGKIIDKNFKISEQNKSLEKFAYIISHDLKRPVKNINGMVSVLEMDEKLSEETKGYVTFIKNSSDEMIALIDGVLNYSKATGEINKEKVDVKKMLEEIKAATITSHTIHLEKNYPEIEADKIQLNQVFQNLIGNAIKYHDKSSGNVWVTYRKEGGYCYFEIADDGPGIDQQDLKDVFTIFHVVESSRKSDSTGIGLAIVKQIVENHGGTISAESKLGEGTKFTFCLPTN
jgi:signal transduction histidine kinase